MGYEISVEWGKIFAIFQDFLNGSLAAGVAQRNGQPLFLTLWITCSSVPEPERALHDESISFRQLCCTHYMRLI